MASKLLGRVRRLLGFGSASADDAGLRVDADSFAHRLAKADRLVADAERFVQRVEQAPVPWEADMARLLHNADLDSHRRQLAVAAAHEPELLDAYVVYGDWLQEKGDPYGDLIAVQVRIVTSGPTRELLRAEADLLRRLKLEGRPWPAWDQASAIARASDADARG